MAGSPGCTLEPITGEIGHLPGIWGQTVGTVTVKLPWGEDCRSPEGFVCSVKLRSPELKDLARRGWAAAFGSWEGHEVMGLAPVSSAAQLLCAQLSVRGQACGESSWRSSL